MAPSAIQIVLILIAIQISLPEPIAALEYPQELVTELFPDYMYYGNETLPADAITQPLPPDGNSSSRVRALFVIGDSSVDCGTNNFLGTFARADRPPYGRDFDTHQPTGRFCNGRIPVDYIGM